LIDRRCVTCKSLHILIQKWAPFFVNVSNVTNSQLTSFGEPPGFPMSSRVMMIGPIKPAFSSLVSLTCE
jgi:hypothetical protein